MAILVFSDLHLDNYRHFSTILPNGLNSRLVEQIKVMKQVIHIIHATAPSAIIFLGDYFNGQGQTISKQLYITGFHLMEELQENSYDSPVFMIVGNHDTVADQHILSPFAVLPNVSIVSEPITVQIDGMNCTLVPWTKPIPNETGLLFGHLDIEGAKDGSYVLEGTVHPKEVNSYSLVINGHWHTSQYINDKILCVGAVMQHDFGDVANHSYGVWLIGKKDKDITTKLIEIESPMFNRIIINSKEDLTKFKENRNKKNYYKLIVANRDVELPELDYKVEVEWDVEDKMETRLEKKGTESLEDLIINFIEQSSTAIDKAKAKEYLKKEMEKV